MVFVTFFNFSLLNFEPVNYIQNCVCTCIGRCNNYILSNFNEIWSDSFFEKKCQNFFETFKVQLFEKILLQCWFWHQNMVTRPKIHPKVFVRKDSCSFCILFFKFLTSNFLFQNPCLRYQKASFWLPLSIGVGFICLRFLLFPKTRFLFLTEIRKFEFLIRNAIGSVIHELYSKFDGKNKYIEKKNENRR